MNDLLVAPPCLYVLLAIAATFYQGVRGWYFQRRFADYQNRQRQAPETQEPEWGIRWMRCLEDALLYAVSTAAGFTALWLAYRTAAALPSVNAASPGAAALLVFFSTVAIVGVAGYLPHFLAHAKMPK